MKCKSLVHLLVFILIAIFKLKAQNGNYELRNVVPPSATAASLGKYGEMPVSLYTGIPNISIPIYEIIDGPLKVPIDISYHAGGIRVEEIASAVGLGWTLNAGGVVGRQQRGRPDEFGWIAPPQDRIDNILQSGSAAQINLMTLEVESGSRDGEADIYYYNFGGHTGKFFFDQVGTIHNYPANGVLVNPLGGTLYYGSGWQITTEDGTVYEFDKGEIVTSVTCRGGDNDTYTAWYLTKIKSSDGKRQISFSYENVNYSASTFIGQTMYFPLNGNGGCLNESPSQCGGLNIYHTHRLKRIDFAEGYVKFTYNNARLDILYGDDKSLDQIEIFTASDILVKKFDLSYAYFGAGNSSPDEKRLKLVSMSEKSNTGNLSKPYMFIYEESIQMPSRSALSVDHWGYYNGKDNHSYINTFDFPNPVNGTTYHYSGADRSANPATMQACILKKIQYPTGGETEFTYESNTSMDTRLPATTYEENYSYSLNQSYSLLSSPYETSTFTIPSQGADVEFAVSGLTSSNSFCNYEVNLHCYLIKDNNVSSPYSDITDLSNGVHLNLPGGTYKFHFTFDGCPTGSLNFLIGVHNRIPVLSNLGKRPVGGLRIQAIEDKPANLGKSVTRKYRYEDEYDASKSSGVLINFPEYGYVLNVVKTQGGGPQEPCVIEKECIYLVQQTTTNYPLATTQGSYVGYYHVIEDMEDNGEVHHTFSVQSSPPNSFPFPPDNFYYWRMGSETNTKYLVKKANGQLSPSKEIINSYLSDTKVTIKNYKVGRDVIHVGECGTIPVNAPLTPYNTTNEFYALRQTKEIIYDQNDLNKYVQTVTNYTYSPQHFQPTQVKTVTSKTDLSKVEEVIVNRKYPFDYNFSGTPNGSEAAGIKKLQDLHVINAIVEEYVVKQNRDTISNQLSSERVIAGKITTYRADKPYQDQILRLETMAPLGLVAFGSGSSINNNSFVRNANSGINSMYKQAVIFNSYDDLGNTLTQQKANDIAQSYVWDYNARHPIAQIINANRNDVASTSFEADETGGWLVSSAIRQDAQAYTGKRCYNLSNGSISKINLSSTTKYTVSYWSANGGAVSLNGVLDYHKVGVTRMIGSSPWTYHEYAIHGVTEVQVSGNAYIDELRLYPVDAQMVTYTYDPLVGMTSQTDAKGMTTYYEYDNFSRLKLIRDKDRNIVKSFQYQYAGSSATNVYQLEMQTFANTTTIGYPVGVFNVNGKLLGNAVDDNDYVTKWNLDPEDAAIGLLATSSTPRVFDLTLNSGQTPPSSVTALRYYQFDVEAANLDAIRNYNGAYVDFGDGTGMRLGRTASDRSMTLPERTVIPPGGNTAYIIHTYTSSSLKTVTLYHNDDTFIAGLDNFYSPASSLITVKNLRGNLPLNVTGWGGSCIQNSTAYPSSANISNWGSLKGFTTFNLNPGDTYNDCRNLDMPQDFFKDQIHLRTIFTSFGVPYASGYTDPSFTLARLKSDWTTYFKEIASMQVSINHLGNADLSGLKNLKFLNVCATNQNNSNEANYTTNPVIPIPTAKIDQIINQVAKGAGQNVWNGTLYINSGGTQRSAASQESYDFLQSRGWTVEIHNYYY